MKLISYVNFLILTLVAKSVLGQTELYPKNLSMAVKVLQATTSDSLQLIVRSTDAKKLFTKLYPSVKQFKNIDNWTQNDENTGVSNYLKKKGVSYSELQRLVIITAFKERLSGEILNEDMLLKPFRQTEIKWRTEDKFRYEADSLRGIYIPKDLSDCLEQINKLWPDSVKFRMKKMAEDDFIGVTHLGMGMWIRNNWKLWGGSRLVMWFKKLGIINAESMSGIILISYHRYLNGREIQLSDQVKRDIEFWKESDKSETERQLKEFAKYDLGDTIQFSYPNGFSSLRQQKMFEADSCIAKGIVMNKNIVNYLIQVKIIQTCDKKGIIYYDSDKTLVYDNQQHKYIKPQFRTKKVIKIGHEYWCNYTDWEPN